MKRVDFSWGSGTATIFLHLNEGQIYNMGAQDGTVLLEKYPGSKTYYSSRSGMSGAGFLLVPNDEIFISLPVYRDGIKYLSEQYSSEVNGTTLMVPMSLSNKNQGSWKNPGVARVNEKLLFIFSIEDLLRVLKNENIPSEEEMKNFSYKYLTTGSRGGVQRFSSERFSATKLCEVVEDQIRGRYSLLGREYLKKITK